MNPSETICLLCGNVAELRHNEYPGFQEPDTYGIYHCNHCKSAFSMPRRDPAAIYENIYKNAERVPGYHRYRKYARSVIKSSNPLKYLADVSEVYWGVREALLLSAEPSISSRVLEIGSGLGYLTYSLVKSNYNTSGIDISENAVSKAKERFGDHYICADIADFAEKNAGTFDLVVSTEVIEHFENITGFLESVLKLLKPGGHAILTTPNKSFFPDEVIWATDQPPVHYWWLSEDSMKYLAERFNASIRFINFRKYYRKNFKIVGLKSHLGAVLPAHCFDSNGELIKGSTGFIINAKTNLQVFFSGIPVFSAAGNFIIRYLKMLFGIFRKLLENDTIVCSDRGLILCAVLQKIQ